MFLNNCILIIQCGAYGVVYDILFYTMSKVIEEHLSILCKEIRGSKTEIGEIVKDHLKVIGWVKEFNRIMVPFIVSFFLTFALAICVLGYEIIKVNF